MKKNVKTSKKNRQKWPMKMSKMAKIEFPRCTQKSYQRRTTKHNSFFGGTVLEIQNYDQSINRIGTGHSSFNRPSNKL